jgi:membrane protease YdiL (CAAX protease family)
MTPRQPSRQRRFGEATLFVAAWMALGWTMHLDANAYLLVGVPLTFVFQRWVARRPLASLWVRDVRKFRLDWRGLLLAIAFGIVPVLFLVQAAHAGRWTAVAWAAACAVGAILVAFAGRQARRSIIRPLLACLATAGFVGIVIMLAPMAIGTATARVSPAFVGQRLLLFLPACFVVEEVTFRGALDTHVHTVDGGRGLASAAGVSALWGLWHLPMAAPSVGLLGRAALLLLVHLAIGVPLSLGWRRSGNLLVPALSHAVIDAVRDGVLLAVRR